MAKEVPAGRMSYGDEEEDELYREHEDIMDTILEEEEQLINAHRVQV